MTQDATQDQQKPGRVKVRVKYKHTENMPALEELWAEPIEAHVDGGTYRLQNSSFVVPLAAGDLVWAEQAGDGVLQVTGLVGPSNAILTVVGGPPGIDLDMEPVVASWSEGGALWTEGRAGLLVTVWSEQMRLEDIEIVIRPTLALGLLWLATAFPSSRTAEHMPEVDFQLERVVVELVHDDDEQ
jgi:hypothetical protein